MSEEKKKKLMPELLPAPTKAEGRSPAARVDERAQRMLQRFKGLGATASAAVLGAHCTGYGVVDPLPPPPELCSTAPANALMSLRVSATYDRSVTTPRPPVVLRLDSVSYPQYSGIGLIQATVMGGTITSSSASAPPDQSTVVLRIMPDSDTSLLNANITVACGGERGLKLYRIAYHLPATASDEPVVEER